MRCDRKDLGVGDNVEVEMYSGTGRAYWDNGIITAIEHHRWDCSCHVKNHIEEVSYTISDSEDFKMIRTVDLSRRSKKSIEQWCQDKAPYFDSLPDSAHSDMRDIYEAIAHEDGEDAYLGDGIWVRPDGSLNDQGR
jgi:hypothetical protein